MWVVLCHEPDVASGNHQFWLWQRAANINLIYFPVSKSEKAAAALAD